MRWRGEGGGKACCDEAASGDSACALAASQSRACGDYSRHLVRLFGPLLYIIFLLDEENYKNIKVQKVQLYQEPHASPR
jgi:hypothetical protein